MKRVLGAHIPDELARRVRMLCAERGVTISAFVEQALREALRTPSRGSTPVRKRKR